MDNVNVTPSGSVPIATDDIDGVQFQKVKVNIGEDGLDAGLVGRQNPLPVEIGGFIEAYRKGFLLEK